MKIIEVFPALVLIGTICGCASVVNSTRETNLPRTTVPLEGIRYFLPKGEVQVSATWDNLIPGWEPKFTIITEPDPYYCYRLHYKRNVLFDDDVTIAVDPTSGLLCGVNATTTDQTVNSLGSLMASAGAALTFGTSLGPVTSLAARGSENDEFQKIRENAYMSSFQVVIGTDQKIPPFYLVSPENASPATSGVTNASNREASSKTASLYAEFDLTLTRIVTELPQTNVESAGKTKFDGIIVRTPVPFTLGIKETFFKPEDSYSTPHYAESSFTVLLPDEQHNYFLPISRRPFVTTSTKIILANGMIESYQQSRPSMVAGIVGIPRTILSALVPIPLEIRQSQANNVQTGTTH